MNMPSNLDDPIDYSDIPKQTAEQIRQFKPMQEVSPALYRKLQTAHMGIREYIRGTDLKGDIAADHP